MRFMQIYTDVFNTGTAGAYDSTRHLTAVFSYHARNKQVLRASKKERRGGKGKIRMQQEKQKHRRKGKKETQIQDKRIYIEKREILKSKGRKSSSFRQGLFTHLIPLSCMNP